MYEREGGQHERDADVDVDDVTDDEWSSLWDRTLTAHRAWDEAAERYESRPSEEDMRTLGAVPLFT